MILFLGKKLLNASAVFLGLLVLVIGANGQIARPVPSPTPDNVIIVSRDSDFSDKDQVQPEKINENSLQNLEEQIIRFNARMKELGKRVNNIESTRETDYDKNQKRLLLNLDILSKAEARAQNLRQQLIELVEKESDIKTRLETIEYQMQPEVIERTLALVGSLRPEQLRESRRDSLSGQRKNMQELLIQIQSNKVDLEENVRKADLLVEKLRFKLEGEIDKALDYEAENN